MTYRAGEVEVLLTVNDKDLDRSDKKVLATGNRMEKRPITVPVKADEADALAGMDRVETQAKKLVSERAVVKLDADIELTEKKLARTTTRLEDLQVRAEGGLDVSADVRRAERELKRLEGTLEGLQSARSKIEVEADTSAAVAELRKVETEKQIVSREVALRVNANVNAAESAVKDLRGELDYLNSLSTTVDVQADVASAEARLAGAEAALKDLQGARATMQVDVATDGAKAQLKDVSDYAEQSGDEGGRRGGAALIGGIIAGLASIPIVGAIASIAHTAADTLVNEFQSALQIEVRQDRLQALTGIDEASAARFARVAGEAYANNFGESIESNMDTTRLALQFDLIDEKATSRDAKKVVEGLAGISDVLDEDVTRSATAVSVLLSSGMASSASRAYDIIATGAREGLNRNEDLLDTLTEYPVVLKRLGLTGEEMLGLLNQGLEAGARNTDVVADALKEFQIRATDASTASADGYKLIGLNAEDMTAKIAAGGEGAREGLQIVLDKLRETEDPVVRNAAAVALFGTKAEDLGDALFALDLTHAVDELNGVVGAADRMFNTLSDNDSNRIERARRNIEVAAEGIKGALASAFADPLGEAADWIAQNRGPVLQFFLDLANGALDFGESVVEGAAAGTEAFGAFVAGPLADTVDGIGSLIDAINGFEGRPAELDKLRDSMRGFDDQANTAADTMREDLGSALDEARGKLNEFGEPAVAMGYLNDASLRLAGSLEQVGYNGEGARLGLEGFDAGNARASESGAILEGQVRAAIAAMYDEIDAAAAAGESQETLGGRYQTATAALIGQLEAMGLTEDQARQLIDTVNQTPPEKVTSFGSNAAEQQGKVQNLASRIETLPDGSVIIRADTSPAQNAINSLIGANTGLTIGLRVAANTSGAVGAGGGGSGRAYGGPIFGPGGPRDDLVPIMASNGEHMWTADEVRAAGGHDAIYRLRQAVARGALQGLADGGAVRVPSQAWRTDPPVPVVRVGGAVMPVSQAAAQAEPAIQFVDNGTYYSYDPHAVAQARDERLQRALYALPKR